MVVLSVSAVMIVISFCGDYCRHDMDHSGRRQKQANSDGNHGGEGIEMRLAQSGA